MDSVLRTNACIRKLLERRYEVVEPDRADLVVCGGLSEELVPSGPPRLIFAHGALGDPGHWLLTIPQLRACDTLALSSSSDEAIVRHLRGNPFCRTVSLPLFVDTTFFRPEPSLRSPTRHRYGIPQQAACLLTASSLEPQKNVQSVLLLARELQRELPDLHCAIVGEGTAEQRGYLEGLTRRLGLTGCVQFLGQIAPTDLRALYNAADLFAHLTLNRKENFGLAPVEAQACGLPVLASSWGGVRDSVLHGETGYYAESYLVAGERRVNWLSLLRPSVALLADPELRARFSGSARAWAARRFSIGVFAKRLFRVVDRSGPEPHFDPSRVVLSELVHPLLVAFARRAIDFPAAKDSRAISDHLRDEHAGVYAYRIIHERMASAGVPEATENALLYRLVDAELAPSGTALRILDGAFPGEAALEGAEEALWRSLERPTRLGELRNRFLHEGKRTPRLDLAVRTLIGRGLVGVLRLDG